MTNEDRLDKLDAYHNRFCTDPKCDDRWVTAFCRELLKEVERLTAFHNHVQACLNEGDGVYRP